MTPRSILLPCRILVFLLNQPGLGWGQLQQGGFSRFHSKDPFRWQLSLTQHLINTGLLFLSFYSFHDPVSNNNKKEKAAFVPCHSNASTHTASPPTQGHHAEAGLEGDAMICHSEMTAGQYPPSVHCDEYTNKEIQINKPGGFYWQMNAFSLWVRELLTTQPDRCH